MSNTIRVVHPQGSSSPEGQVGDLIEIRKDGVIILSASITTMPTSPLAIDVATVADSSANGVMFQYEVDNAPLEGISASDLGYYAYQIFINGNRWPNASSDDLDAVMAVGDNFSGSSSGNSSSSFQSFTIAADVSYNDLSSNGNNGPLTLMLVADGFSAPAAGTPWDLNTLSGILGGGMITMFTDSAGQVAMEIQGDMGIWDAALQSAVGGGQAALPTGTHIFVLDYEWKEVDNAPPMSGLDFAGSSNQSSGPGDIVIANPSEVAAANAAQGGQAVSGTETFASLIGRPDGTGANAGKQRHPEEIKLAGGDVIAIGPMSMDKDWMVVSSVIQGQVASLENHDSDSLIEGGINKYYTTQRVHNELTASHSQALDGDPNQGGFLSYGAGHFHLEMPSDEWLRARISEVADGDLNLAVGADPLASFTYTAASGEMQLLSATLSDVHGTFGVELDGIDDRGLSYVGDGKYQLQQDLSNDGTVQFQGLTLTGDLKVMGTTTTVDSTTVTLGDKIIELAKAVEGQTQVSPDLAGFRIKRADGEHDVGLIWQQDDGQGANDDKGLFLFSKVQGVDPNDALLNPEDLLRVKAQEFIGPVTGNVTGDVVGNVTGDVVGDLTGDVTGQVSDISNHSTSDLAEGLNLYYTDARVHTAVSASKGVQETAGAFEADIKDVALTPTTKLTIQKDDGLEIDFSVTTASGADQRGSLSYSGNILTYTPITKADIQGDIDAENVVQAGKTVFGGIDYLDGMVKLTQVTRADVRGSISKGAEATPSEDGDITYNATSGTISYTPPSQDWVRERLSRAAHAAAAGAGDFTYDDSTGVMQFTPVAEGYIRDRLSEDAANHEAFVYNAAAGSLKLSLAANDAHDNSWVGVDADPQLAKLEISDAAAGEFKVKSLARSDVRAFIEAPAANRSAIAAPAQGSAWANNDVLGGITYDALTGQFSEELLTVGLIRSMFSADDEQPDANAHSVLSYDALTGHFELNELAQGEIRGYIDVAAEVAYDRVNTPIASTQKLADLAYAPVDGELTLTVMDIDDIHSTFKADAASDAGLTYGDDGSFKLTLAASGDSALSYADVTSTFSLTITNADKALAFAPDVDPANENPQRLAKVLWDGSEIGLEAMKVSDVRAMFSEDSDILSYASATGTFSASISASAAVAATLSVDVDGNADDGSQKVGAISINTTDGSIIDSEFLSIADIRKAIKVADNDEGLSYDKATGIFSIDDEVSRSSMTSEAICDGRMAENLLAPAQIERGMLLGLGGQPVAGLEELWGCSGVAREQVAANAPLEQKVALPVPGSRKQLKVAFERDGNGNLTANPHVISHGACLYMSADQPGCITPVMPEAEGESVVLVGFADSVNLDGADEGLVECLMSVQFMFNA